MTDINAAALRERWRRVRDRVERACAAAGRAPDSVRLIAVSKRHPAAAIRVLHGLGQREFGENYVQELSSKADELADLTDIQFRLIGHLQRNKVRQAVRGHVTIDTVDSLALGRSLSKRAEEQQLCVPVLIQVNIGAEPQKSGVTPAELEPLVAQLRALPHLSVDGLLAIPPETDGYPERAREHFKRLWTLAQRHGLPELSMGMSDDLEVGVAEGATMVRVGTAIFGPRAG